MAAVINITSNGSSGSSGVENFVCNPLDDSFPAQVGKILIFSLIILTSFFGNSLIIFIVYKRPELRKTTNYFIVNMAVSDFIFPLAAIPLSLAYLVSGSLEWFIDGMAGLILCKLGTFLRRVSASVSLESLVWIALDRFVAVVLPMKVRLISRRVRAFGIASTWITAIVINSVDLYMYDMVEKHHTLRCSYSPVYWYTLIYLLRVALFCIAPLFAMTILYCMIAVTLRKQDNALRFATNNQADHKKRRAFKMSMSIMASFYICVIPMFVLNIVLRMGIEVPCLSLKLLIFFGYFMLYFSSTINPIICIAFVRSYRRGFIDIFHSSWRKILNASNAETRQRENLSLQQIRLTPISEKREIPST